MKRFCVILLLLVGFRLFAAEVIPPPPAVYFNDYAHVVSTGTAAQLNQTLENFERQSSDQILVAVYPKMQSDSSVADYTVRVARSWQVGQKAKNNGAVLFVFVQDHKLFLQVGYGLEGVLPDALCKRIIDEQIAPRFKAGDFDGGLSAGVQSILAAAKGEYTGTGRTVAEQQQGLIVRNAGEDTTTAARRQVQSTGSPFLPVGILFLVVLVVIFLRGGSFGRGYSVWTIGSGGSSGGWGGGGFGGGGFSGGGGGGFSGGGGSFGGGGAGGSW